MQRIFSRTLAVLLLASPFFIPSLHAQRSKGPLNNEEESDQIAGLRDHPNERIKLYQKFIQQRIHEIEQLGPAPRSEARKAELRAKYEEFTRLCDELQENLDTFDQAHADIRTSLKDLVPAAAKWPDVLNQRSPDRTYDFSRKTALDCAQSVNDQSKDLYEKQKKYFAEHKHEANKNGTGPS